MNKNHKDKRKLKIKGGTSFLEYFPLGETANVYGKFLAEDIDYEKRNNNLEKLTKKYKEYKENAEQTIVELEKVKESELERSKVNLKIDIFTQKKFEFYVTFYWTIFKNFILGIRDIINKIIKIIGDIGSAILGILKVIFSNLPQFISTFITIFNSGQGVVPKTIVLIFIIMLIFGFAFNFFNRGNSNKSISGSSLNSSANSFTLTSSSTDIFKQMQDAFANNIPQSYLINYNSFKTNFNKLLGNDLIGNNREIYINGRPDNINHFKINTNTDYITSQFTPNKIEIDFDFSNSNNTDLDKLPKHMNYAYVYNFMNNNVNMQLTKSNLQFTPQYITNTSKFSYNMPESESTKDYIISDPNSILFKDLASKIIDINNDIYKKTEVNRLFNMNENKFTYPSLHE